MEAEKVYLRTTERRSFANCRQQWWWSFVLGWEAIKTKPALRFGDIAHQSLAAWYIPGRKRGEKPWLAIERIYKEQIAAGQYEFDVFDSDDEKAVDALELGMAMMRNYVAHYGDDSHIRVIAPEMTFQVNIYDDDGNYLFTYVGSLDLVYEDMAKKQLGVIETKTAASISLRHLGLDEQAGSYWAFAGEFLRSLGILKPKQDIHFILYNFLRKGFADDRPLDAEGYRLNKPSKEALFERATTLGLELPKKPTVDDLVFALEMEGEQPALLGERSKKQPPPLFVRQTVYRDEADRESIMRRIKAQAREMAMVKRGELEVWKNPGGTYPNQQCTGCEFADVCELHETGRDWEELARLTMGTWDPYEDHRPVPVKVQPRRKK